MSNLKKAIGLNDEQFKQLALETLEVNGETKEYDDNNFYMVTSKDAKDYDASAIYNSGDIVYYEKNIYTPITDFVTGVLPTDTSKWKALVTRTDTASYADGATNDSGGNNIYETYATKNQVFECAGKATTFTVIVSSGNTVELNDLIGLTSVDWGDGTIVKVNDSSSATHTYASDGIYDIKTYGVTEIGSNCVSSDWDGCLGMVGYSFSDRADTLNLYDVSKFEVGMIVDIHDNYGRPIEPVADTQRFTVTAIDEVNKLVTFAIREYSLDEFVTGNALIYLHGTYGTTGNSLYKAVIGDGVIATPEEWTNQAGLVSVESAAIAKKDWVEDLVTASHLVNITQMSTTYDSEQALQGVVPAEGNGARYLVRTNGATPLFYYTYNANTNTWEKGYQIKGSTLYLNLADACLYRFTNSITTTPYPNFIQVTLSPALIEDKIQGLGGNDAVQDNSPTLSTEWRFEKGISTGIAISSSGKITNETVKLTASGGGGDVTSKFNVDGTFEINFLQGNSSGLPACSGKFMLPRDKKSSVTRTIATTDVVPTVCDNESREISVLRIYADDDGYLHIDTN